MSDVSLRIQTKKVLSARLALWDEAGEDQKARSPCGCLPRESIDQSSSSTRVGVSHQARAYASVGPLTQPVTGIDRPLQAGDRVTQYRKDFFRHYSQALLVEKVVPYRSLHVRDLSPRVVRINATASISVEEATDREATWIEEAIFYSLGKSRLMRWLDRALINPFCNS